MQTTFTIDLATLIPHQREALVALIESFEKLHYIPSADERKRVLCTCATSDYCARCRP